MPSRNPRRAPRTMYPSSKTGSLLTKAAFLGLVGGTVFGEQARAAVPSVGTATEVADVNDSGTDTRNMLDLGSGYQAYIEETYYGWDSKIMVIDTSATSPTPYELCGSGRFGNDLTDAPWSIDLASSSTIFAYIPGESTSEIELTDSSTSSDWTSCSESGITVSYGSSINGSMSYEYVSGALDYSDWNGTDGDVVVDGASDISTSDWESNPARCQDTNSHILFYQVGEDTSAEIWVRDINDTTSDTFVTDGAYPRCISNTLYYSENDGVSLNLYNATITFAALDEDGDGYDTDSDCDDTDASINPGATEVCDGVDNNCDGTTDTDASDRIMVYTDSDQDGVGAGAGELACEADDFQSEIDGDCDDNNAAAQDLEEGYVDSDGDGYGAGESADYCPMPEGVVANNDDCDDADASVWEAEQCTSSEEGVSSGEFSASEEEIVLSSGAGLTVLEGTVSLETNDDEHVLTLNEGSHAWLSTVAIPTIIQMETESNNDARTYVYESARVELVGGVSDGANMMAGGGNSGSGSYVISGTSYGNSETQDSDEYGDDNYDTGLDLDVDSTYYEASSEEDNEFNVCYEDGGNWYQVNNVDGPEEESYLCVRVESGRADAYGSEIQRFTLDPDVMYEFYDGYTCPEGSGEQEPEDEEPDNQNPTNNNPDGTPRSNSPKGCSTSGMTPTGTLAVIAGFLALATGRRREETTA